MAPHQPIIVSFIVFWLYYCTFCSIALCHMYRPRLLSYI